MQKSSLSKEIFDKTPPYQERHLASCGYNKKLCHQQQRGSDESNAKNCKREVIWFKTPNCKLVKKNIGIYFFRLLSKPFPMDHKHPQNLS